MEKNHQNKMSQSNNTSHASLIHISALSNFIGVPFGSIIGPLIFWLIWKEESEFVNENGKEALNFNISIYIYQILLVILGVLLFFGSFADTVLLETENPILIILGIPGVLLIISALIFLSIFRLIVVIIAALQASDGKVFHYPLSIKMLK